MRIAAVIIVNKITEVADFLILLVTKVILKTINEHIYQRNGFKAFKYLGYTRRKKAYHKRYNTTWEKEIEKN